MTATALTDCALMRIEKSAMMRVLHDEPAFSALFTAYLLTRNQRIEEDLIDQLFNSSEKRLARVLLLLAHFGKEGQTELVRSRACAIVYLNSRGEGIRMVITSKTLNNAPQYTVRVKSWKTGAQPAPDVHSRSSRRPERKSSARTL